MSAPTVRIHITMKLSDEMVQKHFLETGETKQSEFVSFSCKDDIAAPYRKHLIKIIPKLEFDRHIQIEFTKSAPMSDQEVYEAWFKAVNQMAFDGIQRFGSIPSNWSIYNLVDIISPDEELVARSAYEVQQEEIRIKTEEQQKQLEIQREEQRIKDEEQAKIRAEQQAKEAEEKARKETNPDIYELEYETIADTTCTTSNPLKWRDKNWAAVVTKDPTKPGGLERRFFDKAKGQGNYYILTDGCINLGDAVMFVSSEYDRKRRETKYERWYVVVGSENSKISLAKCLDEAHMFRYQEYIRNEWKKKAAEAAGTGLVSQREALERQFSGLDDKCLAVADEIYFMIMDARFSNEEKADIMEFVHDAVLKQITKLEQENN